MKETITFESIEGKSIVLPISYNHIVQAMIYGSLDYKLGDFLHNKGFKNEKRVYKMFTFSRLIGDFHLDRENGQIIFDKAVKLTISSPYNEFNNSIGYKLLSAEKIQLGNNQVTVKELKAEHETVCSEEIKITTLSPIVVYSTLFRADGKKFTYYFNPYEKEFSEITSKNIKNKYKAFYKTDPPEGNVEIKPEGRMKLSVVKYKDYVIKGYSGKFTIKGHKQLLELGISSGLGNKNSQGFGCVQLINK